MAIDLSPWPYFDDGDIAAVAEVLRSGKVNQWTGPYVRDFEQAYCDATGADYALAMANGTVTLELALYTLDVGLGHEVIVPSRTFMASASAVVARSAVPVCADVCRETGNVTVDTLEAQRTDKTKAVIVVHLGGWPCDMHAICAWAAQHDIAVIEDCAQAHGATIDGQAVGTFGAFGSFSFCQDKIITTGGEGGILLCNNEKLWRKAWEYRDHGKSYDAVFNREHPPGFRWVIETFGTNMRMTSMQAAIGIRAVAKLPSWTATRNKHSERLDKVFRDVDYIRVPSIPASIGHARYKYYVYFDPERAPDGLTRDEFQAKLMAAGVLCQSGSCSEIYREQAFVNAGFAPAERLPVAQELGETSLMMVVHPTITDAEMDAVIAAVQSVISSI